MWPAAGGPALPPSSSSLCFPSLPFLPLPASSFASLPPSVRLQAFAVGWRGGSEWPRHPRVPVRVIVFARSRKCDAYGPSRSRRCSHGRLFLNCCSPSAPSPVFPSPSPLLSCFSLPLPFSPSLPCPLLPRDDAHVSRGPIGVAVSGHYTLTHLPRSCLAHSHLVRSLVLARWFARSVRKARLF